MIVLAYGVRIRRQRNPHEWLRLHDHRDIPDVVPYEGSLYVPTTNRRLTALMIIQALSRSYVNQVTCHLYSYDAMKWKDGCPYKCTNRF